MRRQSRWGFTVIELLIVIGIVSLLLSLIAPAVQRAREASRRIQCANNLRQIQLAAQQYANVHGRYPASIRPRNSPGTVDRAKYYSITASLLPHLEMLDIYNSINFEQPHNFYIGFHSVPANSTAVRRRIELLLCPSDSTPDGSCPGNSYRFNIGADGFGKSGPFGQGRYVRPSEIVDGMSQTVGLSEKRMGSWGPKFVPSRDILFLTPADSINPPWPNEDEWLHDCRNMPAGASFYTGGGKAWLIDGGAFTTYNHVAAPNSEVVDCMRHMGGATTIGTIPGRSWHDDVVNAAFMDGSIRAIHCSISLNVWRALGTRAGGEAAAHAF